MKFLVFVACLAGIVSAMPLNEPAVAGDASLATRTTEDKPSLVKVSLLLSFWFFLFSFSSRKLSPHHILTTLMYRIKWIRTIPPEPAVL